MYVRTFRLFWLVLYLQLEVPLSDDKRAVSGIKKRMFSQFNHLFNNSLEVLEVEQGDQMFEAMPFEDYLNLLGHSSVK